MQQAKQLVNSLDDLTIVICGGKMEGVFTKGKYPSFCAENKIQPFWDKSKLKISSFYFKIKV